MLVLLGVLLCSISLLLFVLLYSHLKRRIPDPYLGARERLRFPKKAIRLLRGAARSGYEADVLSLLTAFVCIRRDVRRAPPLPVLQSDVPRALRLAREMVAGDGFDAEALPAALNRLVPPATPSEVAYFPLCVRLALVERTVDALLTIKHAGTIPIAAAERMRAVSGALRAPDGQDWANICESADELHALMMKDPSGAYGGLTADSRLMLRLEAERLCNLLHLNGAHVTETALHLCREAGARGPESSLPFVLSDPAGVRLLCKKLRSRRGWIGVMTAHREAVRYAMQLLCMLAISFALLQADQPVWLVFCFALILGQVYRHWRRPQHPIPLTANVPERLRILVLIPAALQDGHSAIRAVRELRTVQQCLKGERFNMLLMGEMPPAEHAPSAAEEIIGAACAALTALGGAEQGLYYMQRSCRGSGAHAAATCLCQLIVQGNCDDAILYSSMPLTALHRAYDYVLLAPEGSRPAPGLLRTLLQALCHPLHIHYPTERGHRGYGMAAPENGDVRLIQPGPYLLQTEGMIGPEGASTAPVDALAGCIRVPGAICAHQPKDDLLPQDCHQQAYEAGKAAMWQLPYVSVPLGLVRNPLAFLQRFHLREGLKRTLTPPVQMLLMLYALLRGAWWLAPAVLAAEGLFAMQNGHWDAGRMLRRISLLPGRAAAALAGLYQGAAHQPPVLPAPHALLMWAQWLMAVVVLAFGIARPAMLIIALPLSGLFAAYPWVGLREKQERHVPEESADFLFDALGRTWSFFVRYADERGIVPETVQYAPDTGAAAETSPEALAGYILAILSAREVGAISADEAAGRLSALADTLAVLPMPAGLPCRKYDAAHLTVTDGAADAAGCGAYMISLLAAAQAVRTWLPELAPKHEGLSAKLQQLAEQVDAARLFDRDAQRFFAWIDGDGQPGPHIDCLADEGLLLSAAASCLGKVSAGHLRRLNRTRIRTGGRQALLSRTGGAAAQLLPGLFWPQEEKLARAFIRLMQRQGREGLFGQDNCLSPRIAPDMRYIWERCGVQSCALEPVSSAPLYGPWCMALCLPVCPESAVAALRQLADTGCSTPLGFPDAVEPVLRQAVGAYSAWHQGLVMAALAHATAGAPLRRFVSALPGVAGLLPLLKAHGGPALRALPSADRTADVALMHPRRAEARTLPPDAHLLGSSRLLLQCDAQGSIHLHAEGRRIIRALHLYLTDGGRVYRIGDTEDVWFEPGCIRMERICGSLKAETEVTLDTVHHQLLAMMTVTNLSGQDRIIEAADCLLPDESGEIARPENDLLQIAQKPGMLRHRFAASQPPLNLCACTDADDFVRHGGTWAAPDALSEPIADCVRPALHGCMAFRARMMLPGRGQVSLLFGASLHGTELPRCTEIPGIIRLCGMHRESLAATVPLTPMQCLTADRLAGLVCSGRRDVCISIESARGTALLNDMLAIRAWYALLGIQLRLMICGAEGIELPAGEYHLTDEQPEPDVLLLRSDMPPAAQIDALYQPLSRENEPLIAASGQLPDMPGLICVSGCTGFDGATGDCILRLAPGEMPPFAVVNRHAGQKISEMTDDTGHGLEQITLHLPDGTVLSPLMRTLARCVRFSPGMTAWRCFALGMTATLYAAALPDAPLLLRVLRIRGAEDAMLTLRIIHEGQMLDAQLPLDSTGRGEFIWTRDASGVLSPLPEGQSTELLRRVRGTWAQRLERVTVSTPDVSFDLLMNHVLPRQALTAEASTAAAALVHLAPPSALRGLLRLARKADSPKDDLALAASLAVYCRRFGDDICQARLWNTDETLMARCIAQLTAHANALAEDASTEDVMRLAITAHLLHQVHPDKETEKPLHRLQNLLDVHHWHGCCYGEPLSSAMQAQSAVLYGDDVRTRTAMRTAWDSLFDHQHHLLRDTQTDEQTPLPGSPENSGMRMTSAVAFLSGLLRLNMTHEAELLLQGIDPVWRSMAHPGQAPNRLSGGFCMPPMAIRTVDDGGDAAASWLYHVVLTQYLGYDRQGDVISMNPMVPADWPDFALTVQEGASTWRILCERRTRSMMIDGIDMPGDSFTIRDDGDPHTVRLPLQ